MLFCTDFVKNADDYLPQIKTKRFTIIRNNFWKNPTPSKESDSSILIEITLKHGSYIIHNVRGPDEIDIKLSVYFQHISTLTFVSYTGTDLLFPDRGSKTKKGPYQFSSHTY